MNSPGSCNLCATWGTITGSGLCYECRSGRYERAKGGLREAVCRRCGWPGIVGADSTCRGCRIAVRLGQDPAWMHAEFERRALPAGRPLQLAVRIEGLALNSNPLRHRAATGPRQKLAPWYRGRVPPALDDPMVCVEEVPGQLGLFAPWPRTFTRAHGKRIRGRTIPDFPEVQAVLKEMAAERRVGQTWHFHTEEGARLALAARPRMSAWCTPRRSRFSRRWRRPCTRPRSGPGCSRRHGRGWCPPGCPPAWAAVASARPGRTSGTSGARPVWTGAPTARWPRATGATDCCRCATTTAGAAYSPSRRPTTTSTVSVWRAATSSGSAGPSLRTAGKEASTGAAVSSASAVKPSVPRGPPALFPNTSRCLANWSSSTCRASGHERHLPALTPAARILLNGSSPTSRAAAGTPAA